MAQIQPRIVVCLGATAARSLIGKQYRVLRDRGKFLEREGGGYITATVHPSSVLRSPDTDRRHQEYEAFVRDLKAVTRRLNAPA